MNCNNTHKCKEPCGDCTQEWPVPAGAQSPAEGDRVRAALERFCDATACIPMPGERVTTTMVQTLGMALSEARAALAAPNVQPKGREAIEWQSGPNQFKDWCAQWFGPDADDAYLARAVASFPAGQPTMGELPPQIAIDKAKAAMGYSQAFDGKGIDWQSSEPWPHRIELAQALDWITDLGAVILNLADRVVPPLVIQSPAPAPDADPLFLLHCGQIDSSGEQDDWDIEADSGKRVEEFCRLHPGQTVNLYPHVQYPAVGAGDARDAARYRWLRHCNAKDSGPLFTLGTLSGETLDAAIDEAMKEGQ